MKWDLFLIALLTTCNNNLLFTPPPPVSSPYHSQNILYKGICVQRTLLSDSKPYEDFPSHLGKSLPHPMRPCTSWPQSHSQASLPTTPPPLQTLALLFPDSVQHVAISVFPLLRTPFTQAFLCLASVSAQMTFLQKGLSSLPHQKQSLLHSIFLLAVLLFKSLKLYAYLLIVYLTS